MRECDRCGKKIQYGTLCDYCKGHCEGFSFGKSQGIKQGRADAIDEYNRKIKECCSVIGSCDFEDLDMIAEDLKEKSDET